jgi:acyl carrier protein
MSNLSYEQAALAVRSEIAKYHDEDFSNSDYFTRYLDIASYDLSVIALSLEKNLGVKLDRRQYLAIKDVDGWAQAISSVL